VRRAPPGDPARSVGAAEPDLSFPPRFAIAPAGGAAFAASAREAAGTTAGGVKTPLAGLTTGAAATEAQSALPRSADRAGKKRRNASVLPPLADRPLLTWRTG